MRLILVPVADRPECARALNTAFDIGARLGASISGCHIRPHRYSNVSLSPAFAQAAWRKKNSKRAPAAAKALFRSIAEEHGYGLARRARAEPSAFWSEKVGAPSVLMGIVGPVSDLVVVSRPTTPGGVAEMFLHSALLESSRPVLVLPQAGKRKIGRRVLIAWNQNAEVAVLVSAALPLLQQADEVTIVNCGGEEKAGPKSAQLCSYLAHWGVTPARVATRGRRVEAELLDTYKKTRGDLLIAGSYSRSRWRERIFGGTTEFLLREARMPLLTMHLG